MSTTTSGPWSPLANILRDGLNNYITVQKTLLDIASQQNTLWMNAFAQGAQAFTSALPNVTSSLPGIDAKTFLRSQEFSLDIALTQNRMALNFVRSMYGNGRPYINELADMLEKATESFVDSQKKLLAFAGQQADAILQSAKDAASNPLAQLTDLSRQVAESFIDAQKRFLDLLAQPIAAQPAQPAADFLNTARQGYENYLNVQREFVESAARQMPSAAALTDLARQSVETFIQLQRNVLDVMGQAVRPAAK